MFSKFRKKKPPVEIETISHGLRSTILNFMGTRGIPTMPNSAQRAFALTVDPNATATDFIEVIESDESLSARILKISNSVYFDRGTPSQTIEESVNKIGLNELRCLLNANSLPELLPSSNPIRPQLWANDIAAAIISRKIAAMKCPALQGLAFLGGLMHDIGKLLILQRLDSEYSEILHIVKTSTYDFCTAEQETLAFNHCEVGQLIAEKWNFTPELIEIIRDHHTDWSKLPKKTPYPSLTEIVKAADLIAHSLGIGHGSGFSKFKEHCELQLDTALKTIGIPTTQKESFLVSCKKDFEEESELYLNS